MSRTMFGKLHLIYRTLVGNEYPSDSTGKMTNVGEGDVRDLVSVGCVDRDIATQAVLAGIANVSGDATKALYGDATFKTPGGLPAGGSVGQIVTNTAPGVGTWQAPAGGVVTQVRVALSSAQLLHLFTSPVQIVPAPGAGKVVQIISAVYSLTFNSAAYTNMDAPGLYYGSGISITASGNRVCFNALTASASRVGLEDGSIGTSSVFAPSSYANQPINLADDQDALSGDSAGSVSVLYATITL